VPDPYFSDIERDKKKITARSALTAVIEILNYHYFQELDKYQDLQMFYEELSREIFQMRRQNYSFGFGVIEPEIIIHSDRINVFSFLYLEEEVPELNMMAFKIFSETLNMILATGLKHELAIRGFAGMDKGIRLHSSSGNAMQQDKKETMVLSDMLKVFSFDEIFPDGISQNFVLPVDFYSYHCNQFLNARKILDKINSIGIFCDAGTGKYPFSEVSIFSDILIETGLNGNMHYSANWINWAEKHPEQFPVRDVRAFISRKSGDTDCELQQYWKKFNDFFGLAEQ